MKGILYSGQISRSALSEALGCRRTQQLLEKSWFVCMGVGGKDILGGWDHTGLCSSYMPRFVLLKGLQKSHTCSFGWAPVLELCAELLGAGPTAATPHCSLSSCGSTPAALSGQWHQSSLLEKRERISYAAPMVFFCASKLLVPLSIPWAPGSFEGSAVIFPSINAYKKSWFRTGLW